MSILPKNPLSLWERVRVRVSSFNTQLVATPSPRPLPQGEGEESNPLEALLAAYGLENERERIADALPYGQGKLELVDILNVMARMGYTVKSLKTRLCDIDERLLPCAFVEHKTGILRAVTSSPSPTGRGRGEGVSTRNILSLVLNWLHLPHPNPLPQGEGVSGTGYIFTKQESKDPKEQKEALRASGYGWFMGALQRFRTQFWQVIGVSFALNFVALAMPLFLMAIYDRVSDATSAYTIFLLGMGAILALSIEFILRSLRSKNLAWFAARIDNIVSNRVLSRLLQLPAHAIEKASVASQVSRLRAFDSVRDFFTGSLFLTILDLPFTLFALLAMVVLGGVMALIPLGLLVLYAVLVVFFRPHIKLAMFNAARAGSATQTHHIELFEKIQALRLNGMSEVWREQFRDISAAASMSSFRSTYLSQILETAIYTLTTIAGLSVIYLGVNLVWEGAMSGGALFASLMLFWRVIAPWQTLTSSIPRLEQLYRSIAQIDRLMALDTERESALALGKVKNIRGNLEFSKIGLRYSKDNDPVFVGLSFTADAGELITVAGGNGSGKSTILKLALGLYKPQAGAIYLDGRDIRQLDPIELRKKIAYVPQIPEMFEGTIADNLRLGNPFVSDFELWQALEMADAKPQIELMAQGLATPILAGSDSLRSSLIYRISLARAYLKNSPIMLIDEMPYAILNSPTGAVFVEQIKGWHGEKTIIMVSHRDDHIRMADKAIGLLEGGKSIIGKPEQIIKSLQDETFKERRRIA